jgi:4-amino-4-deoxy-L-arabinose transferase-like glycosyltransferase
MIRGLPKSIFGVPPLFWVFCFSYLLLSFATLRVFPPVNGDEVSNTVFGYNLLHGDGMKNHLMDDVFEPTLRSISDSGTEIMRVVYNPVVGIWTLFSGVHYDRVRLLSSVMNVATLVLLYLIGARLGGPRLGWTSGILAALQPLFFTVGLLIRPESMVLAAASAILWLELRLDRHWQWKPIVLGLLSGLAVGIHQNIVVFFCGLAFFRFVSDSKTGRMKNMILLSAGFAAGALLVLLCVDLKKLFLTPLAFHMQFYRAPLLTFPWHPVDWFATSWTSLVHGATYYFHASVGPWWQIAHVTSLIGVALGLAGVAVGSGKTDDYFFTARPWAAGLIGGFLALPVLIKRQEVLYFSVLFPFLVPLVALGLEKWKRRRRAIAWFVWIAALGAFGMTHVFYHAYAALAMPQSKIIATLKAQLNDRNLKVLGPATLWFGWDPLHFRDEGAVYFSYLFTGRIAMKRWLGVWKPDVLIADEGWSRTFSRPRPNAPLLSQEIGVPVEFIGTLNTGLSMGLLDVYRIHWKSS